MAINQKNGWNRNWKCSHLHALTQCTQYTSIHFVSNHGNVGSQYFPYQYFSVCLDKVWLLPYCFASYRNCWTNDLITLHSSISCLVLSRVQIVIRFELLTNYIEWNAHPFSWFSFSFSSFAQLFLYTAVCKWNRHHKTIDKFSVCPLFSSFSCSLPHVPFHLCSLLPCLSLAFIMYFRIVYRFLFKFRIFTRVGRPTPSCITLVFNLILLSQRLCVWQ